MVVARLPLPQQIPTRNTNDYIRVLQEADRGGGYYGSGPDGAVSQQELSTYVGGLGQQKQFLEFFNNMFQQFLGYSPFEQQLADLNNRLEIASTMQDNFGAFDGGRNRDGKIGYDDLFGLAGRDGNYNDISDRDIRGPQPGPGPIDPPGPIYPNLGDRIGVNNIQQNFDQYDKDGNGFLDRNELREAQASAGILARNGIAEVGENLDSIMFGSIEAGSDAWFGLSKADIDNLKQRVENGQSIDEAAASIRQERGHTDDAAFRKMVETNRDRVAYTELINNFAQVDADGNGVLDRTELYRAGNTHLSKYGESIYRIARNEHSLMFASIDPGNNAWHGLTRQDLTALRRRAAQGQTVQETEAALREQISQQRGYPQSFVDFFNHILGIRNRTPKQ